MKRLSLNGIVYFASGDEPKLLLHSGTHGDEYEVIDLVSQAVNKYQEKLPSFVFVPEVSPSAVAQKTRVNKYGRDVNRCFFMDTPDPETRTVIDIMKNQKFELFVSFHEDSDLEEYYIYDVGYKRPDNRMVLEHNEYMKQNGIKLLTGVDDPNDPALGYQSVNGYIKVVHPGDYGDDGSVSAFTMNHNITKKYLLPEIPGAVDLSTKRFVVDSFFEKVLIPSF